MYYGETRHREKVAFTDALRNQVKSSFQEMHQLYDKKYTPRVKWSKSCNACSLKDICVPKLGKAESVSGYIEKQLQDG